MKRFLLLLLIILPMHVRAATIMVGPSGSIAQALSQAGAGDTVLRLRRWPQEHSDRRLKGVVHRRDGPSCRAAWCTELSRSSPPYMHHQAHQEKNEEKDK